MHRYSQVLPQDVIVVPNEVWHNNSVNKKKDIISSNSLASQEQILNNSQVPRSSSAVRSDYDSFSDEKNGSEDR
ncbi:hypothetical protein GcM1_169015 [Golovinomyces cichoracearum]|uniref:Uncharacterized protein n=1 Tax=Golovinomyces cichoracearum TaxID=62708 RepID=A0A420J796_9PEZI|nr:hypothetical protein GcM1_169015 [Golovinomyces cichoracearum]